jgi:hypothetical protein
MFYDISDTIEVDRQISKVVLREKLIERLRSLSATVALSDDDGAVEFAPQGRLRGQHPLKNITSGRVSLLADGPDHLYTTAIRYQLSLFQTRLTLVLATVLILGYSLLRGYSLYAPLALVVLSWIFGYLVTSYAIRSQFRALIEHETGR